MLESFVDVWVIRNTPLTSLAKLKGANVSLGEAAVVLFGVGTSAIIHTIISRDLSGVACPAGYSSSLLWLLYSLRYWFRAGIP